MRVGIDVLERSRSDRIFRTPKSHKWILHRAEAERVRSMASDRAVEWCSGRLCGKEAVGKLLGRGYGQGLTWRDIEIATGWFGEPAIVLHGGARRRQDELGITEIQLSISHQPSVVVAVAVAVAEGAAAEVSSDPLAS
nr:4'-phosphopantetheinyl transferase superfamily protein [Flexivirga oryzae]